jgi:hypothetical protein
MKIPLCDAGLDRSAKLGVVAGRQSETRHADALCVEVFERSLKGGNSEIRLDEWDARQMISTLQITTTTKCSLVRRLFAKLKQETRWHLQQVRGHVRSEIPRYKTDVQREGNNRPRVPGRRQLNLADLVGGVLGV